ncbi:ATP-binding protein [Flectobacillus rivi]|uniref:histidine kinase n=1 Tax=Flectobacillus rivi TaxID=2984209 RepID=A0ABT6Z3L4_9BACT|nr:ATP-binding protein [Flectobacillus rivi]MDI9875687.1 ATP-binding protein [Flectobacillus rivi]
MQNDQLHKLLSKQVNRFLDTESQGREDVVKFLKVVSDSYVNFDRDKELFEHSSSLNEKEYAEINIRLKDEIGQRRRSIEKLIEAIHSLETDNSLPSFDADNLLLLVDYLQKQIDNRKKMETELRQAKDAAEKATQAKSEFLSMMSHEIRTPLNAIVGMTYLMQQEECSPTMADNLKTLQFSTDNLHVLINDILDFSKIEAGKVDLEATPFDFKQLVSNIKRANQVKAEEKGNRIRLMVDDDIPDSLIGDPLRLGQILSNLVSNAVKFTINGSISLEISLVSKTDEEAQIYVSVKDSGIGIPPDKQELIFEQFTQANSETTRKFGGTGLGLVITKKLLELHGSKIQLESEEGKGAKFYFTLKLKIGNGIKTIQAPVAESINEVSLKGVKVLLVEDYPVNVKVASKFLTRWEIDFDVAENGLVAVEKYKNGNYDVILMDLLMPEMDGYTATLRIRELNPTIPIIALTASATLNNQDRAFEVGMNDYVTKPFNPKELFQKIGKYSHRGS